MNLKEAFTYQNFYDKLISSVETYFATNSTYTRTFTHKRNIVNPEAENVVKVEVQQEKLPYSVETIIDFALDVMAEKEKLTEQTMEEYTFKGPDLKSVTDSFITEMSSVSWAKTAVSGFDMKA